MIILWMLLGIVGVVILWIIIAFNSLVLLRMRAKEAWSDITVQTSADMILFLIWWRPLRVMPNMKARFLRR